MSLIYLLSIHLISHDFSGFYHLTFVTKKIPSHFHHFKLHLGVNIAFAYIIA